MTAAMQPVPNMDFVHPGFTESGMALPRWVTKRDLRYRTLGPQFRELAELVGMPLMEWQDLVADIAFEIDEHGNWVHPTVAVIVARQSGKSVWLILRIIAGLYIFDDKLILYSSVDRAGARYTFEQIVEIIEGTKELKKKIKQIRLANGAEALSLTTGAKLKILSPRQSAFRGYSASTVILDESREVMPETASAARYTMRAQKNAQLLTVSTAGSDSSEFLHDLTARGRLATTENFGDLIAFFEWSCAGIKNLDVSDQEMWKLANPALGVLTEVSTLEEELRSDPHGFALESLCVPSVTGGSADFVAPAAWETCRVPGLVVPPGAQIVIGVDMDQDRTEATIVAAAWVDDRLIVGALETFENPLEKEVLTRTLALKKEFGAKSVGVDPKTCGAIHDVMVTRGVRVHKLTTARMPMATSRLLETVTNQQLEHDDTEGILGASVAATIRRVRSDGSWSIRRRVPANAITPMMAMLAATDAASVPRATPQVH